MIHISSIKEGNQHVKILFRCALKYTRGGRGLRIRLSR